MGADEQEEMFDMDDAPQLDTSFKQTIVVDGLPVVPREKHEKLLNVVRKFFSQVCAPPQARVPMRAHERGRWRPWRGGSVGLGLGVCAGGGRGCDGRHARRRALAWPHRRPAPRQVGTIVEEGLDLPTDEAGATLGFAFIQFAAEEEATAAIRKANGYKLDKAHTFVVNSFEDYGRYMAISDVEQPFVPPPYVPRENLSHWLFDTSARDQYVVRFNDETEIWWNDPGKPDQKPDYAKKHWSEHFVAWSPRGSYLATFHRLGIQLWGGPSFGRQLKINHGGVKLLDFSPCENYLVTWSPEGDQKEALVVWDVHTGLKCRAFVGAGEDGAMDEWPVLQWSHDDAFFARLGDDCIYVYESSTMKLLKDNSDKRSSIKVDGVRQFLWSSTDNYMSLWIPEHLNNPAKVNPAPGLPVLLFLFRVVPSYVYTQQGTVPLSLYICMYIFI